MKYLFLDLDGTIRKCKSNPTHFINTPLDQELLPNAREVLDRYARNGWVMVGITNQKGVSLGHKSKDQLIEELKYTMKLANPLEEVYACIDEGYTCLVVDTYGTETEFKSKLPCYRKPASGMLYLALERLNALCRGTDFLFVGDRDFDKGCAEGANMTFLWADKWLENSPL